MSLTDLNKIEQIDSDELEITVIGNERMFGESLVIHLPNDSWAVVDSCTSPKYTDPLPLYYLRQTHVDLNKVSHVICSHWHDDHILGISMVLENCPNAELVFACTGRLDDFVKSIMSVYKKETKVPNTKSTTKEIVACLNQLKHYKEEGTHGNRFALMDRDIVDMGDISILKALSPADSMTSEMINSISLMKESSELRDNYNKASVSLLLQSEYSKALLGGDLECNRSNMDLINVENHCNENCSERSQFGWCNVLEESVFFQERQCDYVKISHHGSITGYCPRLWNEHMSAKPIATIANFSHGGELLPTDEMINKYLDLSSHLFMTNPTPFQSIKEGPAELRKELHIGGKGKLSYISDIGIIVSRRKKDSQDWNTTCYGTAKEYTQEEES